MRRTQARNLRAARVSVTSEARPLNPSVDSSSLSQPTRFIKDLGEVLGPLLLGICAGLCAVWRISSSFQALIFRSFEATDSRHLLLT